MIERNILAGSQERRRADFGVLDGSDPDLSARTTSLDSMNRGARSIIFYEEGGPMGVNLSIFFGGGCDAPICAKCIKCAKLYLLV